MKDHFQPAAFEQLAFPLPTAEDDQLIQKLRELPEDYWDFKADDTHEYTHGLHNYPAMMVSPISRNLIRITSSIRPVHSLFDPFSGSGTVLVEGMLAGIPTICGNDINPLALLLCRVKTTPLDPIHLRKVCSALLDQIHTLYQRDESFFPVPTIICEKFSALT